jgi:drug/metabolite transporter (DMT)-like permease
MKKYETLRPIVAAFMWGAAFTFIELASKSFGPLDLMAVRFGLAAICYIVLFATGLIKAQAIQRGDWPRLLAATVSLVFVYNVALIAAQRHLPACLAILVGQAAPMLVLAYERWKLGSYQVSRPWIAVGTWLLGTAIVIGHFRGELMVDEGRTWLAVLCLTPAAMACYLVLSRPLLDRYDPANVCAHVFIIGGMFLFGCRCWRVEFWEQLRAACPASLLAIAGLVLPTTVLAYTLWFSHMKVVGASQIAVYLNLVPVFGFMIAALVLNEPLSIALVLGGTLVIIGCACSGKRVTAAADK